MDYGKIPPQAIDLEEAVLGALMLEKEAFSMAGDFLKTDIFYSPKHQKICNAIIDLGEKNEPIDMLTVANKLKALGDLDSVGGPKFIAELTAGVGSAANIKAHIAIVYEKFLKREIIRIASMMTNLAFDDDSDVFELYSSYMAELQNISQFSTNDYSPKGRLSEAREAIYKAINSPTGLSGVSSGYDSVDKFTGGDQGGDLVVYAGWPGGFKSALILAMQHNAAKAGIPTFMFEEEMSGRQVGMREISMDSGIPIEALKVGDINKDQLNIVEQSIGRLERRKVFIDLSSGIKFGTIANTLRRMKKEENIGLAAIDYLGLCDLEIKKYGSPESAIDNFCRNLKVLAKELDIPIILLAQFVKESMGDQLKVPHMGLLKGSGAIAAHADAVRLLWNPSSVDQNHQYDYMDGSGPFSTFGKLGVVHAKNRQGRTGLQWLNVNPATHTFSDVNI